MSRNLLFSLSILLFTFSASASTEGGKNTRKKAATEQRARKGQRKEVSSFVDPTLELARFVEAERSLRTVAH